MHVCVIGGTGNISTAIVRRLIALGETVTVVNRGRSAEPPQGVRQITIDRRADRAAFEAAMRAEPFDAAIDMICFDAEDAASSVRAFPQVSHFVQCSTVCTYGVDYDQIPAPETHPLRPITPYGRNKVAADQVYRDAHARDGFPVTIIKPSTTYGPRLGLLRQVAWEFAWLDRIARGKPIVICDDGQARHQFLHVDDAALAFCGVLGLRRCIGQTYNMTRNSDITWRDYHRLAMGVIGREVPLIPVPYDTLASAAIPGFGLCTDIFRYTCVYDSTKLKHDVAIFQPQVDLEAGMHQVYTLWKSAGRIPDCTAPEHAWEDVLIASLG